MKDTAKTDGANNQETVEQAAVWVVDAFDQANTGKVIIALGNRGQILSDAIRDLRAALLRQGVPTTLRQDQVD